MNDLDQGGFGWQKTRVFLGPSLGWVETQVLPERYVDGSGVIDLDPGDSVILVSADGPLRINLPDVAAWVKQTATQPATGFARAIWIKDFSGTSPLHPITVFPKSPQSIDATRVSVQINQGYQTMAFYPLIDLTGWYVVEAGPGTSGGGGGVTTVNAQAPLQGSVLLPTLNLAMNLDNRFTTIGGNLALAPIPSGQVVGNSAPGPAEPQGTPLSDVMDRAFGAVQGQIIIRGSAGWEPLPAGQSGYVLTASGPSINPGWLPLPAPTGNVTIAGTPVPGQWARWSGPTSIEGVDAANTGFQPLDADLTSISNLTGNNTIYYRSGPSTWTPVTIGNNMSFSGGVLDTNIPLGAINNINGQTGPAITIQGSASILVTNPSPNVIQLASTITAGVVSINGQAGALTLAGGTGIAVSGAGSNITIGNTGVISVNGLAGTPVISGGTGIIVNTAAPNVQVVNDGVTTVNGIKAAVNIIAGANITVTPSGQNISIAATGTGNVSNSGTPANGQIAVWVDQTHIQGVAPASMPYVQKAGDGMTGALSIAMATPKITLQPSANTLATIGSADFTTGNKRWDVVLDDGANETGGNAGSNFAISRYTDAGAVIDSPISIPRATGRPQLAATPTAGDNSTAVATTAFVTAAIAAAVGGSSFSTGDAKLTLKTVADTGWIMMDDGTIGDVGSGSTFADPLSQPLFNLLFANINDTNAPLLTSAGGATTRATQTNAATAWANKCRMSLTKQLGRAFIVGGSGAGLTNRVLGSAGGEEGHSQQPSEMANHTHGPGNFAIWGGQYWADSTVQYFLAMGAYGGSTGLSAAGSSSAANVMQPFAAWNVMIKL